MDGPMNLLFYCSAINSDVKLKLVYFCLRLQKVLLKAQCNRFHAILQGPLSGAAYWVRIPKETLLLGCPVLFPKSCRFFIPTKQVPQQMVI